MTVKNRYYDYETKKTLHVSITKSTHGTLRSILFQRGLSLQEVFDMVASRICDNDSVLSKLLDDMEQDKRLKVIKRISESDSTSLYRAIADDNPLETNS